MSGLRVQIERVSPEPCCELLAVRSGVGTSWGHELPSTPGGVKRSPSGAPEWLHFAPGRWLGPAATSESLARFTECSEARLVDVEGKFQRRILRGPDSLRLLAAGADVAAMLSDRDCAALSLFDCPAIVARSGDRIDLWVQASYAQALDEQLGAAYARAGSRS